MLELALSALLLSSARAEPPSPFTITTDAGAFEVTRWSAPPARVLPASTRTCRAALSWSGELRVADAGCPEAVWSEARETLSRWQVSPPDQAGAESHALGEVWLVYPHEADRPVSVLLRPDPDRALTLPPGVDALPADVAHWAFVQVPPEVAEAMTGSARCRVQVEIDAVGRPSDVALDACHELLREPVAEAVEQWRFRVPSLDGVAFPTAVTFVATWEAEAGDAAASAEPGPDRRALWEERRFDELSREERLFFIRESLTEAPERDVGAGRLHVRLPPSPELGGRRPADFYGTSTPYGRAAGPAPDGAPLLVIHPRAELPPVEVHRLSLWTDTPPFSSRLRCELLVEVDGEGRLTAWTQPGCPDSAREYALRLASQWSMRHAGEAPDAPSRFRLHAVFPGNGGQASLELHPDTVRQPVESLPDGVHTWRPAELVDEVEPRLRRDEQCAVRVRVGASGRPEQILPLACTDGAMPRVVRAVQRWQWTPAERDGEPVGHEIELGFPTR